MKPVYQTKFGPHGNCMQAAIASILELSLDDVPDFPTDDGDKQMGAVNAFLRPYGIILIHVTYSNKAKIPNLYHLLDGEGCKDGVMHTTVAFAGKTVHDPDLNRGELRAPIEIGFFVAIDPCELTCV